MQNILCQQIPPMNHTHFRCDELGFKLYYKLEMTHCPTVVVDFVQLRCIVEIQTTKPFIVAETTFKGHLGSSAMSSFIISPGLSILFFLVGAVVSITGKRKIDHITDTLVDLHWLPVPQRIQFKLCSLVSKCQHRTAPSYLADTCIPVSAVSGRTHLRSVIHCDLVVPRTRLARYGPLMLR